MKAPTLDARTQQDVMEQLSRRAGAYTPEWRYEADASDPGYALAQLFGQMYTQTIDRFNSVPAKVYDTFLELLGVSVPDVTPATGYVQFQAHPTVEEAVAVPGGTMLLAPEEEHDGVVFQTVRRLEVTQAELTDVYFADSAKGWIEKLDMTRDNLFLCSNGGENLLHHSLSLEVGEVFRTSSACRIRLELRQAGRFSEPETAALFADGSFASWSWFDGQSQRPFDQVTARNGQLELVKETAGTMEPDAAGRVCIRCDLQSQDREITLDSIRADSLPLHPVSADGLYDNDIPLDLEEGGYCFGRRPGPYSLFYLRCDEAFQKRGATILLDLDMATVVEDLTTAEPQYTFNKYVIDKRDAVVSRPDDVFVQSVVWEYCNADGWAGLTVTGSKNPFSGQTDGPWQLRFSVPEDTIPTTVNAQEGWYIRARVVNVENYFSTNPRWLLPFIKGAACTWEYPSLRPCTYLCAENNAKTVRLEQLQSTTDLRVRVYENLPPQTRAMYLAFDRSPQALPLSILFEIWGEGQLDGKLQFEAWNGKQFELLRMVDSTGGLCHTGTVQLYLTRPIPAMELFGQKAHWLRMTTDTWKPEQSAGPRVASVLLNAVLAVQKQQGQEQLFSTGVYDAGKELTLLNAPVMDCQVWVQEAKSISTAQLEKLEEHPEQLRIQRQENQLTSCQVLWKQVDYLALYGPEDRVYTLDGAKGIITFGNGINGMVPPGGEQNIQVLYAWGGGSVGNLPAGAINTFVGSVPRIGAVTNPWPMTGGTDRVSIDRIEALGGCRLRHRGRALTVQDYENLVMERFPQVEQAKCFPHRDEQGKKASGHVTVVVLARCLEGSGIQEHLSQQIYEYLVQCCDCNLAVSHRLHVVLSTQITVNVQVMVHLPDLDQAAETQQAIEEALTRQIDQVWQTREIGSQIQLEELYQVLYQIPNVDQILQLLAEGGYYRGSRYCLCALEDELSLPYATVKSGTHTIKLC